MFLADFFERFRSAPVPGPVSRMPRIGTIATMPSRLKTFERILPVISSQVDQLFVFLDGFDTTPPFLAGYGNVSVIRSQDTGDYHSSGRFLCLDRLTVPSVILSFDDDIHYPRNYVARLVDALEKFEGNAVVGLHGNIFLPPFTNYVTDRKCLRFHAGLRRFTRCDQLGAGTVAFCSDKLNFDVREWPTYRSDDGYLALEAKKRDLPLWSIPRWRGWLKPIRDNQVFSIWENTKRDPTEKSALMRQLVSEKVAAYEAGQNSGG